MCQTTTPKAALLRSRALWLHYMLSVVSDDDHFDMRTFVQQRPSRPGSYGAHASYIGVTANWPWCNTAACIGGTIVMLGYTAEERGVAEMRYRGFTQMAAEWLGLDNSQEARELSGTMFAPGPMLYKINRQHAIAVTKKFYEDGVWYWRAVPGLESFIYGPAYITPGPDRGDPIYVEWNAEPDTLVDGLFALRDRIRKAYWDGNGQQPWAASAEDDYTPVCLLTGAGWLTRNFAYDKVAMHDALRAATPLGTSFIHISDSGLDNAVALIDTAILIRLGVIPAVRDISADGGSE